ncbi:MAG: hypothetical protein U0802_22845 [Candidatus Binatia bacterium]
MSGVGSHVEATMVEGALNAAAEQVIEHSAPTAPSCSATATARPLPRRRASTAAAATTRGWRSR